MLKITHLHALFSHSQRFCLRDISLDIKAQEKVALVGESGSGKSMLAQLILRLNPQSIIQSGSITFHSYDITAMGQRQIQQLRGRDIAYIPQEPLSSLNPLHKVGRQITESLYLHAHELYPHLRAKALHHKAQEKLEWLLESVGLDSALAHAYPFELSGGQKQRVAIAMSIINKPQLLICDEPTTALDVVVQRQIMQLLVRLNQQSAILFISHDLNVVRRFCDRVIVLKGGEIVESASSDEIFSAPKHDYTRFLIDSLSLPARELCEVDSRQCVLRVENFSVGVKKQGFLTSSHKAIVSPLSFALKKGQILGVAGASGSGKSSLALGLLYLLQTRGEVYIEGRQISHTKADVKWLREHVSIVFQDPFSSLCPRFCVGEIIAEALGWAWRKCEGEVIWALESVGLDSALAHAYPFELSGGQKQRVAIARAIVRKPKIMLLDEPTTSLDKSSQKLILTLLLELQKKMQMSYVLITHDLEILRCLSDEVLILHNGEVVEYGESARVFNTPQSPAAKDLIETFFGA